MFNFNSILFIKCLLQSKLSLGALQKQKLRGWTKQLIFISPVLGNYAPFSISSPSQFLIQSWNSPVMSLWHLLNLFHQTWQSSSWISLTTTLRKAGFEESQRCSPTAITGSWPRWWCAATQRWQLHHVSAEHLASLSRCCVLMEIGDPDSNLQHKDWGENAYSNLVFDLGGTDSSGQVISGWEAGKPGLNKRFKFNSIKQPTHT